MAKKRFERSEYAQNDQWAKRRAKQLLDAYQWGIVKIRDEDYGYDLLHITPSGKKIGIEVEVKRIKENWPYDPIIGGIDIPSRRWKLYPLETIIMLMVCPGWKPGMYAEPLFQFAWMINARSLKPDRLFHKSTWKDDELVTDGEDTREEFFHIPAFEARKLQNIEP